ncbi:MAG TPA: cytochrome C [Verrucomicrobiales bacterium]|nr:cytochrome C [Verrucomicrobiales bacterium]
MIRLLAKLVGLDAGDAAIRRGIRAVIVFTLAGLLLVGVIAGALLVVSGAIPTAASSRHWAVTEWFLHFTMRRSIDTHSLGTDVPSLDQPDLVLKGATHYEIGCRSCHGSPGGTLPRIPQQMTPHPPYLPLRIGELKPRELFYVVKHGVKFTGMPAWPTQKRDDEIWAVVAFLQKMPGLDEAAYHQLVNGPPPPTAPIETLGGITQLPHALTQSCMRCHGHDGLGRGSGAFPKLAGQSIGYLQNALKAYAQGRRHSGIMEPLSAGLDSAAIRDLARHYHNLRAPERRQPEQQDTAAIAEGESIARRGIFTQRVPSCIDCHAPEGRRHKPAYPLLAGQPADYLVLQLELFKDGRRGGSDYAHLMDPIASRLQPAQMRAVALYFEFLAHPSQR